MINSIHYIAIVQGIVFGTVLLLLKLDGKRNSKYLALFLLFLSAAIINESYGDYCNVDFHVLYPFKFFFLLPNIILLHINSKISETNSRKNILLNFVPGIIEFTILSLVLFLVKFNWIEENSDFIYYFDEAYNYLTISYTLFIQFIILKKIKVYNQDLYTFQSTIHYKYLNWLKWACVIIIVNEIYYTLYYLLLNETQSSFDFYIIYTIIELALIFYIGIGALLQVNLKIEIQLDNNNNSEKNNSGNGITKTSNKMEMNTLFKEIESFMHSKQPFLNPELNLKVLSQTIKIPERQISMAINQNAEQNFYSYINHFRVDTVKQMFANNEHLKYSIIGVGEAAGFNSKSSFYSNFKRVTGSTPSEYIKEMS